MVMNDVFSEDSTLATTGENSVMHMCVDQSQKEKVYSIDNNTSILETALAHANQNNELDTACQNNSAVSPNTKPRRGRRTNLERPNSQRSSSSCSIKDYFKRKRDLDDSLEKSFQETADKILASSKKKQLREEHICSSPNSAMTSTPIASSSPTAMSNCDTILNAINNLRNDSIERIDGLKTSNENKFTSLENKITMRIDSIETKHKAEIKDLKEKVESLAFNLKMTNKKLESDAPASSSNGPSQAKLNNLLKFAQNLENKERRERKTNIIIKGLKALDNPETATNYINDFLKIKFNLKNCFNNLKILGKDHNIYKITLTNLEVKKQIMINKRNILDGTRIYIENDLTALQASKMHNLRLASKDHKSRGAKVKLYRKKVCIDDKWMQWDEDLGELRETQTPIHKKLGVANNPARALSHKKN